MRIPRGLAVVAVVGTLATGATLGTMTVHDVVVHQDKVAAAHQTDAPTPSFAAITPEPTPTPPSTPSMAVTASATASPPAPTVTYPIVGFSWPAAGIDVSVVPMEESTWRAQAGAKGVNPPLDGNGYDMVAHWLAGTGQAGNSYPGPVVAAHTCHIANELCTEKTFPFNRLSFGGWAPQQPATMRDAAGHVIAMTLDSRVVVPKGAPLPIVRDPHIAQFFSCNLEDPDAQITLVRFRF